MQGGNQQRWRLCFDAKTNNFIFKLKATIPFSPNFKIFPFSIFLKYNPFHLILKVKSQPHIHFPRKQTSIKSKLLGIFEKLRIRRPSKNKSITANKIKKTSNYKKRWFLSEGGAICVCSLVFGSISLLYQERDGQMRIIVMRSCIIVILLLFCLRNSPLKNLIGSIKLIKILLAVVNVTMVGSSIVTLLNYYFGFYSTSRFFWKACNYIISSGCLYTLSQVYLGLSKYLGVAQATPTHN